MIAVIFREPIEIEKEYHNHSNCPPRERGEGCYGDCVDCYSQDIDRFSRYLKKQDIKKYEKYVNTHIEYFYKKPMG